MYERVFWTYCTKGQPLEDYNVSQIVEQAVWLRDEMIKEEESTEGQVEPWLLAIPDPRIPPEMPFR